MYTGRQQARACFRGLHACVNTAPSSRRDEGHPSAPPSPLPPGQQEYSVRCTACTSAHLSSPLPPPRLGIHNTHLQSELSAVSPSPPSSYHRSSYPPPPKSTLVATTLKLSNPAAESGQMTFHPQVYMSLSLSLSLFSVGDAIREYISRGVVNIREHSSDKETLYNCSIFRRPPAEIRMQRDSDLIRLATFTIRDQQLVHETIERS